MNSRLKTSKPGSKKKTNDYGPQISQKNKKAENPAKQGKY